MSRKLLPFAWAAAGLACLLATAGLLHWQHSRLQVRLADERLDTARVVQVLVERQIRSDLDSRAELIAGNQAFIGYLTLAMGGVLPGTETDTASIVDLLEERRAQLGLSMAAVIDGRGQKVVSGDRLSDRGDFSASPLFVEAVSGNATAHGVWSDGQRLFYVAMVPLAAYGSDAGFLLVGTALDDAALRALADAAKAEVALFSQDGEAPMLVSSTASAAGNSGWMVEAMQASKGQATFDYRHDGDRYRGYVASLFASPAAPLLVLVPGEDAWRAATTLGLPMIVGVVAGLLVLLGALLSVRRRVDRQAGALARVMEHAAATGDYHLQVAEADAGPLAPIAVALNRLMARLNPRGER
jgi:hypothetical protein